MSGTKSQFVLTVRLHSDKGDPREQIRRATCDLSKGSTVEVMAGNVAAIPFAMPFLNYNDTAWYRPDIRWLFKSENEGVRHSWKQLERELVEFTK